MGVTNLEQERFPRDGYCEGKMISKAEESLKFGVDERSIQRDIDDIRAFLNTRAVEDVADQRKIAYNRVKKGYEMTGCEGSMMSNSEILAVSKILLESRAFTKEEIETAREWMNEQLAQNKAVKDYVESK